MNNLRRASTVLLVTVALIAVALPNKATASDDTIRLFASGRTGPIGIIRVSNTFIQTVADAGNRAMVAVDGRVVEREQHLWGGELISVPKGARARVSFDKVGEVTLGSGALARFASAPGDPETEGRHILIASLINGMMRARLGDEAGAYVEAGGKQLLASAKADFRVTVEDGMASEEALAGELIVTQSSGAQANYRLRPPAGQGARLSVAARSTRQIQIQVTDENDRPVPDVAVIFSLGDPCLGTIGVGAGAGQTSRERTDSQGIATAPWTVGAARCVGAIAVSIEGTRVSFTYNVDVKQNTFWNARNSLLVAAAAAGAGAAIIIADPFEDSSEPIRPVPPPVVRP
jgi:hypothetical protein